MIRKFLANRFAYYLGGSGRNKEPLRWDIVSLTNQLQNAGRKLWIRHIGSQFLRSEAMAEFQGFKPKPPSKLTLMQNDSTPRTGAL